MSNSLKINGSCLGGCVKVAVSAGTKEVGACHCSSCRKWSGGPLMAIDCGTNVSFDNEDAVSVFNSSDWAERGFCKHCGTHLFYRLKQSQQYIMPVGLFDGLDELLFDHQIFVDEKPAFYNFSNQTKMMTGAEVFAAFSEPVE